MLPASKAPYSTRTLWRGVTKRGGRVTLLIVPPGLPEGERIALGPFTTSMRSMVSGSMLPCVMS